MPASVLLLQGSTCYCSLQMEIPHTTKPKTQFKWPDWQRPTCTTTMATIRFTNRASNRTPCFRPSLSPERHAPSSGTRVE